jgi:histidyl-tRNA synthetase
MQLAQKIRQAQPGVRLISHCGQGSLKSQFKRADKSQAKIALILGEQELNENKIGVKYLRSQQAQTALSENDLLDRITELLESE